MVHITHWDDVEKEAFSQELTFTPNCNVVERRHMIILMDQFIRSYCWIRNIMTLHWMNVCICSIFTLIHIFLCCPCVNPLWLRTCSFIKVPCAFSLWIKVRTLHWPLCYSASMRQMSVQLAIVTHCLMHKLILYSYYCGSYPSQFYNENSISLYQLLWETQTITSVTFISSLQSADPQMKPNI